MYSRKIDLCIKKYAISLSASKSYTDCLKAEIELNSIAGRFKGPPLPNLYINCFGVIPKSTPGKRRLITDLPYLQRSSVNAKGICRITYKGIQKAINKIVRLGMGALMAKLGLCRAYRCFHICESDRYLLEMYWKEIIM